MLRGKKIFVVLPAYNAVLTLAKTVAGIDRDIIDEVLVVDDASTDETAKVADNLGLLLIRHQENRGYGGNQKTCYAAALMRGADVVVMLHPDYQYSPALTVPMASMIAYDAYDFVLGSRVLAQNAVEGGMPHYKYFSNRALTFFENVMTGSEALRVSHRVAGLQPIAAREPPTRGELGRLRVRQRGNCPGPDDRRVWHRGDLVSNPVTTRIPRQST